MSTRYTYDPAGNIATMVDARGNTTTYGYDAAGRMTTVTDPLGETLVWVYDALGNKLRQENRADPPMTASVQWTYDGAGRMLTRVADGVTTTYTYDANGNKLTATDGTLTITSTYDRLNRPLTVDDEDAGSTADTSYTYSLTSPAWTDPTGSYTASLDKFDRATAVNDPVNATDFTWTYRADGQPASFGQPNGNTTAYAYDATGRLTSKDTTAGATDRALYDWTHNRAGQILTEASTVTGDASNGTVTYAYDPLGRLTGSTHSGTTTAYGWDAVPNRTSVQVGAGTAATTAYDAADRPTTGANPTAAYTSDDDGRLTARPGYRTEWDHLGRLVTVRPPTGGSVIASYTYDPLDRLRLVDYGGSNRVRFRYVGLTTGVAQWLDDQSGTVTRHVANGWGGERLADWTGSGSNLRVYGTNGHHDTTWLASSTGSVSQSLRYDPWGNPRPATVPTGYTPFRFQGSWFDDATELSWVVTRWYAPALGRFVSEDSLLGQPADPPSRHLYVYGEGEPVGSWDPDGRKPMSAYGAFHPRKSRLERETENQWRIAADSAELVCIGVGLVGNLLKVKFGLGVDTSCEVLVRILRRTPAILKTRSLVMKRMWTTKEPGRGVRVALKHGIELLVDGRVVETRWAKRYTEWAELHFNYYRKGGYGGWTKYGNEAEYDKAYERCVREGFNNDWPKGPFWRCYEGAFSYRYVRYGDPFLASGKGDLRTKAWPQWYVEGHRRQHPGLPDRKYSWYS